MRLLGLDAVEEHIKRNTRAAGRGETPQALRDVSVGLRNIGGLRHRAGDFASARTYYEDVLALDRRRLELFGPTPQTLVDIEQALEQLRTLFVECGDVGGVADVESELRKLAARAPDDNQPVEAG